jgi:hypothetical protein
LLFLLLLLLLLLDGCWACGLLLLCSGCRWWGLWHRLRLNLVARQFNAFAVVIVVLIYSKFLLWISFRLILLDICNKLSHFFCPLSFAIANCKW